MARRKRRTKGSEETAEGSLPPAWPSSPIRPPKYTLSCYNHVNGGLYVVNACAMYAISKILDRIVGDKVGEVKGNVLSVGEIDVTSDDIEKINEYEYTDEEDRWELPAPYPDQIDQFMLTSKRKENSDLPKNAPVTKKISAGKVKRVSGGVTIQQLCEELGMEASAGRAALRKAKVEKPAGGWSWGEGEVDAIRTLLMKAKK